MIHSDSYRAHMNNNKTLGAWGVGVGGTDGSSSCSGLNHVIEFFLIKKREGRYTSLGHRHDRAQMFKI